MDKKEIIKKCCKGLSEDIDGDFYEIYDASRLYDLAYTKGREDAAAERVSFDDFEADFYSV